MSLNVAIASSISSLLAIEQEMNVASNNIANASTTGYTAQKVDVVTSETAGIGTGVSVAGIESTVNQYLEAEIVSANSSSTQASTTESYYDSLQQALGDVSSGTGGSDISSDLSTLQSDLTSLADSPDSTSAKAQVVEDLEQLTADLRSTSSAVQSLRQQADDEISTTVDDVNTQLGTINQLNAAILTAKAAGQSTADLEDQRATALQSLSADIGINYYINGYGQAQVYTSSGQALLVGNTVSTVTHAAVADVTASTSYPGSIDGIDVNGTDITGTITSGKLAALVQQRDQTLPAVQDELDNLASSLGSTLNGLYSQGSSDPPQQSLTGTASVAAGDAVTVAAGTTVSVAVTNSSGTITGYADVDLSGDATVGDIVNSLNSAFASDGIDATASIDSSGNLDLSATGTGDGIAVSTASGSVGGTSLSAYFGLNSLLVNGASAETIAVNSSLASTPGDLATGTLTGTAVGATAVASGDGSIATDLADALTSSQNFAAAGNLGATTSTFADYAASIISDVATRYQTASGQATTAQSTLSQLQTTFSDQSGVNVDEQSADLTQLQNLYDASAQVIAVAKSMFQTLVTAIQ